MISSFFVLSPRGDTILSKMYRTRPEVGAHERSHTEAFFRRVKFWNDMQSSSSLLMNSSGMGSEFGSSGNGNVDAMGLGAGAGAGATLAGLEQGVSGNPIDAATASGGGAIGVEKLTYWGIEHPNNRLCIQLRRFTNWILKYLNLTFNNWYDEKEEKRSTPCIRNAGWYELFAH